MLFPAHALECICTLHLVNKKFLLLNIIREDDDNIKKPSQLHHAFS